MLRSFIISHPRAVAASFPLREPVVMVLVVVVLMRVSIVAARGDRGVPVLLFFCCFCYWASALTATIILTITIFAPVLGVLHVLIGGFLLLTWISYVSPSALPFFRRHCSLRVMNA